MKKPLPHHTKAHQPSCALCILATLIAALHALCCATMKCLFRSNRHSPASALPTILHGRHLHLPLEIFAEKSGLPEHAVRMAHFDVAPRYLFNATLDYELFMVPGLMAMLLVLLTGFLPAVNIVEEKELDVGPCRAGLLHAAGLGHLRTGDSGKHRGDFPLCLDFHPAGVKPGAGGVELLRNHATGGSRHLLFPRDLHSAEWTHHTGVEHAGLGQGHHEGQPSALLLRGDAHALTQGKRPARPAAPSHGTDGLCGRGLGLGHLELQEERVKKMGRKEPIGRENAGRPYPISKKMVSFA